MFVLKELWKKLGMSNTKASDLPSDNGFSLENGNRSGLAVIRNLQENQSQVDSEIGNENKKDATASTQPGSNNATATSVKNGTNALKVAGQEGSISALDESMDIGVIDHTYEFTISKWDDLELKRNQRVTFSATYDPPFAKWKVTDLKLCLTEATEGQEDVLGRCSKYRTVVCIIKNVITGERESDDVIIVGPKKGAAETKLMSLPKKLLPTDFPARTGDWLTIRLQEVVENDATPVGQKDEVAAEIPVKVEWTEQKETLGHVVFYRGGLCIGGSIHFTTKEVENRVQLRPNDQVRVISVLSDQRQYTHRACFVKRIRSRHQFNNTGLGDNNVEGSFQTSVSKGKEFNLLLQDKSGVRITPSPFVRFKPVKIGQSSEAEVTIQNKSDDPVILVRVVIGDLQDVCKFQFHFEGRSNKEAREGRMITLQPNYPLQFKISCTPVQLGRTSELCLFDFGDFQIARWLSVVGLTNDDQAMLSMTRHKEEHKGQDWRRLKEEAYANAEMLAKQDMLIIRGPSALQARFFIANHIPNFSIPKDLLLIYKDEDTKALEANYKGINWLTLDASNYQVRFHLALWFEEAENEVLRRQYDIHNAILTTHAQDEFIISVPNLKEFQPPVLLKEPVRCFDPEDPQKKLYSGHISHIVYPKENSNSSPKLHLKFHQIFHSSYNGQQVTVQFCLGRNTYRKAHFAIDEAMKSLGQDWLFPHQVILKSPRIQFFEDDVDNLRPPVSIKNSIMLDGNKNKTSPSIINGENATSGASASGVKIPDRRPKSIFPCESNVIEPLNRWSMKLRWFNPSLNDEQKSAVKNILRGQGRPLPFIIFGPPGTGKTVTLVEAILQIYFMERSARILVCVPSNAGADLIAEKLVSTNRFVPGDLVRLNGFARSDVPMSNTIVDFCVDGEDIECVAKHRLIICTVATAGQFFQLHLTTGHFSHAFLDEAGHCMEPEALIPAVLTAMNKQGQIILAGDPKQLGPVLMCSIGINAILNISFLERLMECPIYSRDEKKFPETKYNPAVLTRLVRCYRSHQTLIKLPSELFYSNELVSHATYEEAYELCDKLNFLPKKGVPLIFHGIQGISAKDSDSPSCYNLAEVFQVSRYVALLKENGVLNQDIGIITPYRKQVEKIKYILELTLASDGDGGDDLPKVASVEEFQGGERKVIIISTVRTEYTDLIRNQFRGQKLNFIFSKKRFNVAVTRAKALMIVVGDPHVLFKDNGEIKCWSRLLRFADESGVYVGCEKPLELLEPKLKQFARRNNTERQDNYTGATNDNNASASTTSNYQSQLPSPVSCSGDKPSSKNYIDIDNQNDNGTKDGHHSVEESEDGYGFCHSKYYSRF